MSLVHRQNLYVPSDFSAGGDDLDVCGDDGEFDVPLVDNLSDLYYLRHLWHLRGLLLVFLLLLLPFPQRDLQSRRGRYLRRGSMRFPGVWVLTTVYTIVQGGA